MSLIVSKYATEWSGTVATRNSSHCSAFYSYRVCSMYLVM